MHRPIGGKMSSILPLWKSKQTVYAIVNNLTPRQCGLYPAVCCCHVCYSLHDLHQQFTLVKTHVFLLTLSILFAQSTQKMHTICVHLPALLNYIGIFVVAQKFGIFQRFTLSKMKRDRSCDFLYKIMCKLCSFSLLFRYKYFKKFMKNRYIMYRESVHLLR